MNFFYNIGISLGINLPIVWICDYLSGVLAFPLFMPGTLFILLMSRLNKWERIFAGMCLGLAIDAIKMEHSLFGFSALLLTAPMILFQKKSWGNVFKYRTFFWTSVINFILQFISILVHLCAYGIPVAYIKVYGASLLLSAIIAGGCGFFLLKLQNKYFSIL